MVAQVFTLATELSTKNTQVYVNIIPIRSVY